MKHEAGYYIDQTDDIALVYPCGRIEVFTAWGVWDTGGDLGYYFLPKEYLGPL